MKKLYSFILLAALSVQALFAANSYGLPDNIQQGNILHCFSWTFNDIKAEMKNIAEAGFVAVQTSPAQDGGGGAWYMLYQPYQFEMTEGNNPLGSSSDLEALCDEAHKYGVKVIVDVVANHLNGSMDWVKTSWRDDPNCWHNHGGNIDYSNRWQVTHGDIGMRDLNTSNSTVYNDVAEYISFLKGLGVDGIRWDAAKHIDLPSESDNSQFWPTVTQYGLYNYGEILKGPDDTGTRTDLMQEYTKYICVTDNEYGVNIRNSINGGNAYDGHANWGARGVSQDKLVLWSESHDTYSNDGEYGDASQNVDQNVIDRAYALVASRDKEAALYFSRPFETSKANIRSGVKGSTHFTSAQVAQVNKFRNAMVGQADYYVCGNGAMAVCREKGAVVVKASGSGSVSINNGGSITAPGTYTDQITGNQWTVTSSTISGEVGSTGIAVLYDAVRNASVSLSPNAGAFRSETLTVSATLSDADSGWYKIDNGSQVNLTNGATTQFTIGDGVAYGSTITVSWSATGESDTFTGSATYTKVDPNAPTMVYYNNPNNWSQVYCYAYNENGSLTQNATWPGVAMSFDNQSGLWYYELPDNLASSCKVIFNDSGSSKYPSSVGLDVNGISMICKDNSTWEEYTGSVVVDPDPTPDPDVYTPSYKSGEIVVFFENTSSWDKVGAWVWIDNGANYCSNPSWPGDEMELMGKAANGNEIYKWTYSGSETNLPGKVIFNNHGGGAQTTNFDFNNGGYYTADGLQRLITASDPSAIDDVEAIAPAVTANGNTICVWEVENEDVVVYDLCGSPVAAYMNAQGNVIVNVPSKGIYVVKVGDYLVKIATR